MSTVGHYSLYSRPDGFMVLTVAIEDETVSINLSYPTAREIFESGFVALFQPKRAYQRYWINWYRRKLNRRMDQNVRGQWGHIELAKPKRAS